MAKKTKDMTPVAVDSLKIDELNLLRLSRATEKGRAANLELQMAGNILNGMFQKFVSENEDAKKISDRIQVLQAESKKAQADYAEVVSRLSETLEIDMSKFSYDDETGVLHALPVAPEGAPN